MESAQNMQSILQRLGDLKSFFLFGQKIIPTFQKIIDFMQDTIPLLENVNHSIHESTNKIPKAAIQINSVTNATEIATTEILDIVDGMFTDLGTMNSRLKSLKDHLANQKNAVQNITAGATNDLDIDSALNHAAMNNDLDAVTGMVDKIQEGMTNITISLQVQDITAQQLSSVNHLIQSIQEKLASLLYDLSSKNTNKDLPEFSVSDSRNESFNPDARYDKNHKSQELADTLVNENTSKTSQEEIDKLFSK